MIKTRLIGQVPSSKKYIALTVLAQWIRLCANIVMMFIFSHILELILGGATMTVSVLLPYIIGISAVMTVRYVCGVCSSKTSFLASAQVKKVLRGKMYKKLTRMGASYHEKVSTSEVLQVFVEGVDQLELYFGKYLPQMKWINFGGGHHITKEGYDIALLKKCIRHMQETYGLTVYIEPGEAVALNAGFLVAEVLDLSLIHI